jgi:hypothetical protein
MDAFIRGATFIFERRKVWIIFFFNKKHSCAQNWNDTQECRSKLNAFLLTHRLRACAQTVPVG